MKRKPQVPFRRKGPRGTYCKNWTRINIFFYGDQGCFFSFSIEEIITMIESILSLFIISDLQQYILRGDKNDDNFIFQ